MEALKEEQVDLEEMAVRAYFLWKPLAPGDDIFDEDGHIRQEIKEHPGYDGLVDGLLGMPNDVDSYHEEDYPRYMLGYENGRAFRIHIWRCSTYTDPEGTTWKGEGV